MIRNSHKDPRPKSKEQTRVKTQQLKWIKNHSSGVDLPESGKTMMSSSEISMNNWGEVSSRVAKSGFQSNFKSSPTRPDPSVCRKCYGTLKSPTMLIPCGHSFCKACLDSSISKCPECLVEFLHKVPNLALEEVLKSSKLESRQSQLSFAASVPDFDQEPAELLQKYKEHLHNLQSRIDVLSEESKEIENV